MKYTKSDKNVDKNGTTTDDRESTKNRVVPARETTDSPEKATDTWK